MTETPGNYAMIHLDGHWIWITEVHEQGGGLEELNIWCRTCDHQGQHTDNIEYRDYEHITPLTSFSAMWRIAFLRAERHARDNEILS